MCIIWRGAADLNLDERGDDSPQAIDTFFSSKIVVWITYCLQRLRGDQWEGNVSVLMTPSNLAIPFTFARFGGSPP